MACFYSVREEDQRARQCHVLLSSPERRRQSLDSAGIRFRLVEAITWSQDIQEAVVARFVTAELVVRAIKVLPR